MAVQWTEEQKKVIELRNRNILVSAAAGSGKTAVLVERIIRMLTDEVHPLDVDRLLIVTFTEAAAAEMKERIRAAIEKALEARPEDVHLQRQSTLIHSAHITTIHGFCLQVIREYFHVIDLDPGFRIAEEGELKLLKQDVLAEVLEACYAEGEPCFLELVEKLGGGRNDRKLEELVQELYKYSRSYPQPEKWLAECVENYQMCVPPQVQADITGEDETRMGGIAGTGGGQFENGRNVWTRAEEIARRYLADACQILRTAVEVCEEADGPYLYLPMLESDLAMLEEARRAKGFQDMYQSVTCFKWQALSRKKDEAISAEKREAVKKIRERAKKQIKELAECCFFETPKELGEDMTETHALMQTFAGVVQMFADAFAEKKKSRGMIDFNDMEQFAFQILVREDEGNLCPSAVAREYQRQFVEVMIDEYQDSNLIQEAILTSVSGVSQGTYNIFMVGDVKQSIYRFRLSRPELFMEKYDTYPTEDGEKQRIDLHRNFRSRGEVLDSVNAVFARIMRKELGGIMYDESAALRLGAAYEELTLPDGESANQTELWLLDTSQEADEREGWEALGTGQTPFADEGKESLAAGQGKGQGKAAPSGRQLEARMVARRIKELVATHEVWDKEANAFRRARYQDIVILTRSIKGWSDVFLQELTNEGIPVYAGSREGYFETYEVSVLLNYLQLLENQRQDVPLASVLTSPFVGLLASQMAEIRTAYMEGTFFEAAERFAGVSNMQETVQDGENRATQTDMQDDEARTAGEAVQNGKAGICGDGQEDTRGRLREFYATLKHFRELVPYTPIHELLWKILEETGYGLYIAAMPGGRQRAANVEMLVEKAAAFEGTSYKGLFHFVRYIEQLKKYDVDYGEANIADEQSDTVRILSIHKSKGLEFPIVFVCGMGKQFNMQDVRSAMVIHPEWGVGLDCIDLKRRTKAPTLLKKIIQHETKLENLGEELRVLYVAMTRAKEKLILTGEIKDGIDIEMLKENVGGEKGTFQEEKMSGGKKGAFPFYELYSAKQYMDWILPAALAGAPVSIRVCTPGDLLSADTVEARADVWARDVLEHWDTTRVYDARLHEGLQAQFSFSYPYEKEGRRKLKFTVSELKKRAYMAEESGELLLEEPEVIPLLPQFLQEEEELTGASRGTAYHRFLELLDFSRIYDEDALQEVLDVLVREERMTQEMAECIRLSDILDFLDCESGRRMRRAAISGRLFKEQPFVLGVPAGEVYAEADVTGSGAVGEETVLVQGIIDVYFEEEDGLVLLDYKTDKVRKASDLAEKYHAQLDYYAKALQRLLEKPVKEKWIYSFTLKEEIQV